MISLLSKGLSRVFSNTTVQEHQFFGAQPSLWSTSVWTFLVAMNKKSVQCAIGQQVALSLRRVMWPVGKSRGPWEPITKLDLIE